MGKIMGKGHPYGKGRRPHVLALYIMLTVSPRELLLGSIQCSFGDCSL